MPEFTGPYAQGTPCWVELTVPDQQAALDFYGALFGWQGEIGPAEMGGYTVCTLHGKPVAGVMNATPPGPGQPVPPPVWTTYLAVDDADGAEKAVIAAGGSVMVPTMDVMNLGRMAVVIDPAGTVFGLWQAREFAGAQIVNESGAVVWNELHVPDATAASAFYRAALSLEAAPMEGAEGYFSLNAEGRAVGGMAGLEHMAPGTPPHWLVYFAVDDPDATAAALARAGGQVLLPPFDMIAGRMSVLQDPQGAVFAIINPTPM